MKLKTLCIIALTIAFLPLYVFATEPSSSTIYEGIDVSNWQGYINYQEVKNAGIEIVYIKSSQGNNVVDSYFKVNYNNAKANGLKVGLYHFLTATNEEQATEQAEFFVSVISNTVPDCKLAMDFEEFGNLTVSEINNISQAFLNKVKELTGKDLIIYSDTSNARNVFGRELASQYPLWVAEYGVSNPGETNWDFWEGFQYTSMGEIPGVSGFVDRNKFTSNIFLSDTSNVQETGNLENYNQDTVYVVQRGNTLSQIARDYGTTVNKLVQLNNINNPNLIFPGERINVPINGNTQNIEESAVGHRFYTVQSGDTLSELALRFGTTVSEIAELNNIQNVNLIFTGELLRIPR